MNRASKRARKRWGTSRTLRGMEQCRAVLEPHQDMLETEAGLVGLLMVSGMAALVNSGAESSAALADTIKQAAAMTGVPQEAFEAHARFAALLLQGFDFNQQEPTPR